MKNIMCKAVMCKHNDANTPGDVGFCQMSNIFIDVSEDNRIECVCFEEKERAITYEELKAKMKESDFKMLEEENKLRKIRGLPELPYRT